MKIVREQQILDAGIRKEIIEEMIDSNENLQRKNRELKKHEIYRDLNSKWVMRMIAQEGFREVTVEQMRNRASNISICRKIINKLAKTYLGGVERDVEDDNSKMAVETLEHELDFNQKMKKADRYRQLFKNCMVGVLPYVDTRATIESGGSLDDESRVLWNIGVRIFAPWEYDVIEDPHDKTRPMVTILTTFPERYRFFSDFTGLTDGAAGRRTSHSDAGRRGDRTDQKIADSPEDDGTNADSRHFIWWSDQYHFTTDVSGTIIDVPNKDKQGTDSVSNPIMINPLTKVSADQDGLFWAQGGDDVVDTSLLINKQLTDINFITFTQGWGQLVITGKDLPKVIKGGPDNAFLFEVKPDDPAPQVFYATSNPPVEAWLESIRSQLAMLLSTNNLSTKAVATKLDAATAESGIALAIQNSEVLDDLKDVRQLFQDLEPEIWEKIRRWHGIFSEARQLVPALQEIPPFESSNVRVKFHELRSPISEKEKLEEFKLRKELGLSDLKDLMRRDNPELSDKELNEKMEAMGGKTEEEDKTTEEEKPVQVVVPPMSEAVEESVEGESVEDGENG